MVSLIANTEAAWSCLEYERSQNINPQCQRAFQAVEECRIEADDRRLCAPVKSIDNLEKCENGRRELIDLRCLPKDCSCDIDVIDETNSTQIAKCIDFRIQFVANPCFSTIENLQKAEKFSIPYNARYSYENRDDMKINPRKYSLKLTPTLPPPVDHHQIATILLIVIGLAILVVVILIGFLWRAAREKNRFEKKQLDPEDMETIVQSELNKYALTRKERIPFIQKC